MLVVLVHSCVQCDGRHKCVTDMHAIRLQVPLLPLAAQLAACPCWRSHEQALMMGLVHALMSWG